MNNCFQVHPIVGFNTTKSHSRLIFRNNSAGILTYIPVIFQNAKSGMILLASNPVALPRDPESLKMSRDFSDVHAYL